MVNAPPPDDMGLDRLLDRGPAPNQERGRVTLLGDAAHPILPHAGQETAQALEDAVTIGRALDGAVDVEGRCSGTKPCARAPQDMVGLGRHNAGIGSIRRGSDEGPDFAIRPGSRVRLHEDLHRFRQATISGVDGFQTASASSVAQ